ncbi:MAG TPA: PAS domain S-box protein, partial [Tepidisphaeraceae bacterium]|nr:PAS domain S-box protein [Tepidisphaeraceae bacterium]
MSRGTQSTTDAGSAPAQATRFISRPAHTPGPKPWLPYAAAVVATALAAALRGWLTTLVGPSLSPFLTYYPVVMLVALLGGAGPGLLATALTALAVAYLSLPPTGSVAVHSPADQLALVLFCAINLAVTLICAAFRAARHHTLAQICRARASEVRYRRLFEAARDGVLLLDTGSHKITDANPFFLQLLGYSREELLGKELWQIGLLKDAPASRAAFDQLATTGHIRYEDLPLQAKTGEPREVELVSIVYDENGRSVIQCNVRDITDRKRAEAERTALREQLAADLAAMNYLHDLSTRFLSNEDPKLLLESTLDVAIAIARASKGNIQLLDSASNQLAISVHRGFNEQFIQYFSHIHPGQAACGTILQTHQRIIVEDITLSPIFAADPRALQLKLAAGVRAVTCTPLLSRANQLLGVLSVHFPAPHRPTDRDLRLLDLLARQAADFTERTQTEAALRQSETRLRLATETAELGTYERDLLTNRLTFNATCRAIMGFTGDQPPPDVARRSIHPDDEERVLAAVARAYAPDLREICAAEFRILRPDGTFRWVAGRGRVLFDDSAMPPRPARFIGVLNATIPSRRAQSWFGMLGSPRTWLV